jgi:hypothetical protein
VVRQTGPVADGRLRTAAVVLVWVVVGTGLLAGVGIGVGAWVMRDAPRSFDPGELDPIIAGTEVVEAPAEGCGQGREPAGDCVVGAEVRSRDGSPVVEVVAANAEAAGFTPTDTGGLPYEAERGDRCLSVHAASPPSDAVRVFLGWC